jgi:hypothetical protein
VPYRESGSDRLEKQPTAILAKYMLLRGRDIRFVPANISKLLLREFGIPTTIELSGSDSLEEFDLCRSFLSITSAFRNDNL